MRPGGCLLVLAAALGPPGATAQSPMPPEGGFAGAQRTEGAMPVILPLRERAAVIDRWLERRLETVAPEVMRREGVDLWIVAAREYNEDPVIENDAALHLHGGPPAHGPHPPRPGTGAAAGTARGGSVRPSVPFRGHGTRRASRTSGGAWRRSSPSATRNASR